MNRLTRLLALLALLTFGCAGPNAPAYAAGATCVLRIQDGTGLHPTLFWDPLGTCAPGNTLVPVQVGIDNSGTVIPAPGSILAVTPTDRGGTITAGLTSQTVAAANASRKAMHCENPTTATEPLYFAVVGAATIAGAGNWADVAPGGSTTFSYNGTAVQTAITVNATTTGHRFICTEMQ